MGWFRKKKEEDEEIVVVYTSNIFLEAWYTFLNLISHRSIMFFNEFNQNKVSKFIHDYDFERIKHHIIVEDISKSFKMIKLFGELVLEVEKKLFMKNTSDNPVFAEKQGDNTYVYFRSPEFVIKVSFYTLGSIVPDDPLEEYLDMNNEQCIGIQIKRELGQEQLFAMDLKENDLMLVNMSELLMLNMVINGACRAMEQMYNQILTYTIKTYFSVKYEEESGKELYDWKDILTYGL